jgi:hypothetical protein
VKTYLPAIVLTIINLALLIYLVFVHVSPAITGEVVPVVRSKAFEIIDDNGNLRAQITILPASTNTNGQAYQDTVLFRLIDPNGRPGIKIGTSIDGGGISIAGDSEKSDWSGIQILADGKASSIILTNKDGQVETITP